MHTAKRMKAVWQSDILYDSKHVTAWESKNYRHSGTVGGCQEPREGWIIGEQGFFRAVKLYDAVMMVCVNYSFVKTHRMCNIQNEL